MYLIETTEIYRVDSEDEAKELVEEAKRTSTVAKYSCVYKEKKAKGEIIILGIASQLQKNGMMKKNLAEQLKCLMVYHVLMIVRGKNENKTSF